MNSQLSNKVYIVTGGSKGFGLAIASELIANDAKVGLLARDKQALHAAVEELGSPSAFGIVADVGNKTQIAQAFEQIEQHFGKLDGLINNAGLARPGPVEHLLEEEVLLQVNTNFIGTVFCCQVAIPLLRKVQNARIINISSASAFHLDEMQHLSIYAATKAAVERFTRDLRLELQEDGIGVTCIRPGGAWTSFADNWNQQTLKDAIEAWHRAAGGYMDAGMEPKHVAAAVVHALTYPAGVAIDLLEVRPNQRVDKMSYV